MKLAQIIGQDKPIYILSQAMRHNKLAHAYLFCGPEGVGKKTTALALAQALNCHRQTGDACMECPACRKIEHGQSPDVHLIEADGQYIKIETIRRLQQEVSYKAFEGRVKLYIIDQAERLTPQAANCLLKSLEEPPPNSLLILISAKPYNLLPTVVSRCQQLSFKPLSVENIVRLLKEQGFNAVQCRLIAFFCQGSLASALQLDMEPLLTERTQLIAELISRFPLPGEELLDWAQQLAKDEQRLERLLKWLMLWYRDLLIILSAGEQLELVNEDMRAELTRQAAWFSVADIQQKIFIIERTKNHLKRNINAQLALEVMFMDLNLGYRKRNDYEAAA